MGAETTER